MLKLEEDYEWLKIFQGVFIGIEGIAATLYLIVPADDFQSLLSYCTAMIKVKSQLEEINFLKVTFNRQNFTFRNYRLIKFS